MPYGPKSTGGRLRKITRGLARAKKVDLREGVIPVVAFAEVLERRELRFGFRVQAFGFYRTIVAIKNFLAMKSTARMLHYH